MKASPILGVLLVLFANLSGCGIRRVSGQPGVRGDDGSYRLHRTVVLDASTATLLLAMPQRNVVAIDAVNGDVQWTTSGASAALVSQTGLVLAIGNPGGFAVLSLLNGNVLRNCPTNESLNISDGLGSRSDVQAAIVGKSAIVHSTRSTSYAGGPAPTPEMMAAAQSSASAMLQVDLGTCKIQPATDKQSASFDELTTLGSRPYAIGALQITIRRNAIGDDVQIVLARSRQGSELPPIELARDRAPYLYVSVSVDGRHVWVANQRPKGSPIQYNSRVFDVSTGLAIGEFTTELYPTSFYVAAGETLVTIGTSSTPIKDPTLPRPLGVRGTSLSNGAELWWHEVLDPEYRGPYPP